MSEIKNAISVLNTNTKQQATEVGVTENICEKDSLPRDKNDIINIYIKSLEKQLDEKQTIITSLINCNNKNHYNQSSNVSQEKQGKTHLSSNVSLERLGKPHSPRNQNSITHEQKNHQGKTSSQKPIHQQRQQQQQQQQQPKPKQKDVIILEIV